MNNQTYQICPQNIKYIEKASTENDEVNPAWIAQVQTANSGKIIYFNGMALVRANKKTYLDQATGEEYYVSSVGRRECHRDPKLDGPVFVERSLLTWFLDYIKYGDASFVEIIDDLPETTAESMADEEEPELETV